MKPWAAYWSGVAGGLACLADLADRLGRAALPLCDRCQVCRGLLPGSGVWGEGRGGGESPVCPVCAPGLAPRHGGFCPRCGAFAADADAPPGLCLECRQRGRVWDGFAFHGRYEGLLRELVLGFKFSGHLGQGRLLAGFLVEAWLRAAKRSGNGSMDAGAPDCLVPVPLYPRRLSWRGFNQSLELARLLGRELSRPVCAQGLVRVRNTIPQSRLPGRQRLTNLVGAFEGQPRLVAGRHVLLIDDVMTTGATVETAVRALRLAGATRVDVAVVAR